MTGKRENPPAGKARPIEQQVGESRRDYPHSSGDRNTKKSESDWKEFEGGTQRDAGPAPGAGKD